MTEPTTVYDITHDERTSWLIDSLSAVEFTQNDPLFVHLYGALTCLKNLRDSAVQVIDPDLMPVPVPPEPETDDDGPSA
jgi:hypothetical protein